MSGHMTEPEFWANFFKRDDVVSEIVPPIWPEVFPSHIALTPRADIAPKKDIEPWQEFFVSAIMRGDRIAFTNGRRQGKSVAQRYIRKNLLMRECAELERRIVRRKRGVTKLRARLQAARHELLALELGR